VGVKRNDAARISRTKWGTAFFNIGKMPDAHPTVDHHAVLAKLDAGTRAEAASIAIHSGLIKKQ
jgi:hypothetical protein